MQAIEKNFVIKSFNASAATYDQHAGLQKKLIDDFIDFGELATLTPATVLDIGMGTGNLTRRLSLLYPDAGLYGCDIASNMISQAAGKLGRREMPFAIAADAEMLPFKNNGFDLVVSSFTYQWLTRWNTAFTETARVLVPGGTFCFCAFGENTFFELRDSYLQARAASGLASGSELQLALSENGIREALTACSIGELSTRCFTVEVYYPGMKELMRAIKGMGARNASPKRHRSAGLRKLWTLLEDIYAQRYGFPRGLRATFEIILAKGRAGANAKQA